MLGIGVAGLLLSTAFGDRQAADLGSWLDDIDVPVVLMERAFGFPHVSREYDHVRTDHAYGAMLALRHLASLGHRRIGINLTATATAHWLRLGIDQAAGLLGVDLTLARGAITRGDVAVRVRRNAVGRADRHKREELE